MYQAQIQSVQFDKVNNTSVIVIQFLKDGQPYGDLDKEQGLTLDQLKVYCLEKIANWQKADAQLQGMQDVANTLQSMTILDLSLNQ